MFQKIINYVKNIDKDIDNLAEKINVKKIKISDKYLKMTNKLIRDVGPIRKFFNFIKNKNVLYSEIQKLYYSKFRATIYFIYCSIFVIFPLHIFFREFVYPTQYSLPEHMMLNSYWEIGITYMMITFWLLPIWMLIVYGNSLEKELRNGFYRSSTTRSSKKKYFKDKIKASFWIGFGFVMIPLIINFVVAFVLFFDTVLRSYSRSPSPSYSWMTNFDYSHPYFAMVVSIILTSILAGILMVFITNVVYLLRRNFLIYPVVFFPWFISLGLQKFNVVFIMQPFTRVEFGDWRAFINLGVIALAVGALTLFTYLVVTKNDEL